MPHNFFVVEVGTTIYEAILKGQSAIFCPNKSLHAAVPICLLGDKRNHQNDTTTFVYVLPIVVCDL